MVDTIVKVEDETVVKVEPLLSVVSIKDETIEVVVATAWLDDSECEVVELEELDLVDSPPTVTGAVIEDMSIETDLLELTTDCELTGFSMEVDDTVIEVDGVYVEFGVVVALKIVEVVVSAVLTFVVWNMTSSVPVSETG